MRKIFLAVILAIIAVFTLGSLPVHGFRITEQQMTFHIILVAVFATITSVYVFEFFGVKKTVAAVTFLTAALAAFTSFIDSLFIVIPVLSIFITLNTNLVMRTEKLPYWRVFMVLSVEAIDIRRILCDLGNLPESMIHVMSGIITAFVICFLPYPRFLQRFLRPKQSSALEEV